MKYLAITAILCLILAGASFAGNVTMTEVITGGNLTLTMPANFSLSNITLGGASGFTGDGGEYFYIEDSRGTGAGWNLGVQIDQFKTSGTPSRTIAVGNFRFADNTGDIYTIYGQARDDENGPIGLAGDSPNVQSTEVKVVQAKVGYGMGKYRIATSMSLDIYPYAYAGTYTATLTATLNNVP